MGAPALHTCLDAAGEAIPYDELPGIRAARGERIENEILDWMHPDGRRTLQASTTQSQLAQGIRLFAAHPDQWELLAQQPELARRAVDEILRFEPITPFTARIMLEDVTYRDVLFPKDTVVMVCAFTANRDPETIADPDSFDITADRGSDKPLTFGAGIHYCLGANLAKAELQEGLAFLAPRMPELTLDGEPELGSINGIYGLEKLPVRFTRGD